jgi:hypothetical protein
MAGGKPGRRASRRHPDWSKETLLREMREGVSVADCTAKYAVGKTSPNVLYQEIVRWRHNDKEFERQYIEILTARGVPRLGGGVPKELRDPTIADWRVKFCEDLFSTGKMLEASRRSPFCYEEIVKKLNKNTPSYDEDFAEMVQQVRLKICAEMEGGFVEAFRESSGKDKAWIAKSWLERQDPTRWSKQVELVHSGKVEHQHNHSHQLQLPKEQRLAALAAEQERFFSSVPALSAPKEYVEEAQILEGELVESP